MPTNQAGTMLSCTNAECACRLRIETPCPHGDTYTCACGHPFVPIEGTNA
jgi:metallothionein